MSKITINELSNSLKDYIKDKQNIVDNSLETNNKTIVGAINELVQNSLQNSNKIEESTNRLYDLMLNGGYEVNNNMDMDDLLDLLTISGISVTDIKQIACKGNHTFILKNDGSLWACGDNQYGQLGLGDATKRTTFTLVTTNINNDVKQVACGNLGTYGFTVILKNDGSVWSCGYNNQGQLGLNDTTQRYTFTKVTTNISNDVKQVACGRQHTMILKNDGSLWSCGQNNYGQLGLSDTNYRTTFNKITTNINNDVKEIVCYSDHTFIIKNDGSVWACGYNNLGQLGLNDKTNRTSFTQVTININNDVKQIACGEWHTMIVKNDGSLWACGSSGYGVLGLNTNTNSGSCITTFTQVTTSINNDVKQVVCGGQSYNCYTYIIKNDGSLWVTGYNSMGVLGLNDTNNRTSFTQVTTNINNNVKQIACGYSHAIILKNNGSLWACGYNDKGQLGLSDTTSPAVFTQLF